MLSLSLTGVDFNSAPMPVRERLSIARPSLPRALEVLGSLGYSGVILSTCNRTEVYAISHEEGVPSEEFFRAYFGDTQVFMPYIYTLSNRNAAEHLFEVAAGLDSMVVGEFEVLGQVSHALEAAEGAGVVSEPIRHLLTSAIRAGRRVRQETDISKGALSISAMAVECAASIVPDFIHRQLIVIGAGEAGRLVAKVAHKRGVSQITLVSHNPQLAHDIASELGVSCCSLNELPDELSKASTVVTCSLAPHWVLSVAQISQLMTQRPDEPLVLVDIGIPRNVEPAAGQIANVFLYNIDDLNHLAELNRLARQKEIQGAKSIITQELSRLGKWWRAFEVRPVIRALSAKAEDCRRRELEKFSLQVHSLSDEEWYYLEKMTQAVVKGLLKEPLQGLKSHPEEYKDALVNLFQLNLEGNN